MASDEALAQFQGRMLALLYEENSPREIHKALIVEFGEGPFRDFLQQMEPQMIEVAAELVKKWGLRDA